MKTVLTVALGVVLRSFVFSQNSGDSLAVNSRHVEPAIQDNSFFIEEAYNQEPGVVQHISTFSLFRHPVRNASYSFTQEWPIGSQTHQLSFTLPYSWIDGNAIVGVGDLFLNYRYQIVDDEDWPAISPRVSIIFPAGNKNKGLGNGVLGVQFNLPISKRFNGVFVGHANAGATIFPNVSTRLTSGGEVKRTLIDYNAGGSIIALVTPKFNIMLELSTTAFSEINDDGDIVRGTETLLSPGARAAIDVGQLQIVPGLAVPVSFSDGETHAGVFFYLSFEHPF